MAGSIVETVKQTLDAIAHRNGNLNAFVTVMRDGARGEAEQLDRKTESAVEPWPATWRADCRERHHRRGRRGDWVWVADAQGRRPCCT